MNTELDCLKASTRERLRKKYIYVKMQTIVEWSKEPFILTIYVHMCMFVFRRVPNSHSEQLKCKSEWKLIFGKCAIHLTLFIYECYVWLHSVIYTTVDPFSVRYFLIFTTKTKILFYHTHKHIHASRFFKIIINNTESAIKAIDIKRASYFNLAVTEKNCI